MNTYIDKLKNNDNVIETLSEISSGLFKTFNSIYKFLNNQLEGRTNSNYDIGEIIPYRQQMIGKVGILESTFDLLTECKEGRDDNDEEGWADSLHHVFSLHGKESGEFKNTLDLIFETLF